MWDHRPVGEGHTGLRGEHWRGGGDEELCTAIAGERI